MLTARQYEAIGRLTIDFNGIEQLLDRYLPIILGNPEATVASLVADAQIPVARKIDFFKNLLQAILSERPTAESEIAAVLDLLGKAKDLSGRRNEYVHSFAFVDWKARKRKLRTKKGVIECNENDIIDLANRMDDLTVPLSQALYKLQTVLTKLRYT